MPQPNLPGGPSYLIRGISLLGSSGLRRYVLLPLLINVLVFCGMIYLALSSLGGSIEWFVGLLPAWLSFIEFLLWPLLFLALLGIVYFTFTVVGNFIAAPFNGLLSEKVQELYGDSAMPDSTLRDWFTLLPKSLGRELRKMRHYLPRALLLLVISFIPVVNLLSPLLWFFFNSWMASIQYCDYAADNRRVSFSEMVGRLGKQRGLTLGFGMAVSVVLLIPFINLLIMPAAVVGSTLLWEERYEADSVGGRK